LYLDGIYGNVRLGWLVNNPSNRPLVSLH
jgi:hypothetical protein